MGGSILNSTRALLKQRADARCVVKPVLASHHICGLWNHPDSQLRKQMLRTIERLPDAQAIDILRKGYRDAGELPVTICVTLTKRSSSWAKIGRILRRLRKILDKHGLHDILCEVMESTVSFHSSVPSAHVPEITTTEEEGSRLVSFVGTSISPLATTAPGEFSELAVEGTLGPYLKWKQQDGSEKTVALTCRHVVQDEAQLLATMNEQLTQPINIIQPGPDEFRQIQNTLNEIQEQAESGEIKEEVVAALHQLSAAFQELSARIVGQVLFAPRFALRPVVRQDNIIVRQDDTIVNQEDQANPSSRDLKWLTDWALVDMHQDVAPDLANQVIVSRAQHSRLLDHEATIRARSIGADDVTLELSGTVSESELLALPRDESNQAIVAKVGAATGLTLGSSNGMCSSLRSGNNTWSQEWCIIGMKKDPNQGILAERTMFSAQGDSGASVWFLDGRIAGMLTSGRCSGFVDVTYATPIERLLNDIRERGYDVELP
ncbi:unnamed protein product [Clonostachys solani]|uniref:Uncharacterized protein n=1 Tax=Clonostachys solani TaxID=160281 RepID=A0A9N9Z8Y4_9HYPO|nr:unnamed protein product [Clonostachys solani]